MPTIDDYEPGTPSWVDLASHRPARRPSAFYTRCSDGRPTTRAPMPGTTTCS